MKFCKDCKHFSEIEHEPRIVYEKFGHEKIISNKKRICLKVQGIKYNPVYGYVTNPKELPSCYELRSEEPNSIYPRCGYGGKWFEPKGEIKS